jgi:class 3 adenylate cyclase
MTAPDPDHQPDPASASPEALATGQRTLAAIVFTDTVGFSASMRRNEELTVRLVSRDFAYMKVTCEAFGGQVLKSTGDGLLMLFTSAVQAVACALEIQRDQLKRNLELSRNERLQHRIGIHLGDVFQHGGDAMGDGVNIAARLQTEAIPGGICLSKTVYDVVHNRLPFYVNDLGARRLKNIGLVTAYQISPTQTRSRFGLVWYQWRPWFLGAGWLLGSALLLFLVFRLGMYLEGHPYHSASSATSSPRTGVPPHNGAPNPAGTFPEPTTNPPGVITTATEQEFELAKFDYMRKYDFEGMRDWIATHEWPDKSTDTLDQQCQQFQHLLHWTQDQLHGYSVSRPLVVTGHRGKKTEFWTVSFGGLRMKTGYRVLTIVREQIAPAMLLEIIDELMKEHLVLGEPGVQLTQELAAYSEYYHVKLPDK